MNIPENSFITLVEYNDPLEPTVTWSKIDGEGSEVIHYTSDEEKRRIAYIIKQQMDIARDTPADKRAEALRALAKAR